MKLSEGDRHDIETQVFNVFNDIYITDKERIEEILTLFDDYLDKKEPSLIKWIKEMFDHAEKKEWYETYWAIDVHGTISRPDYRKEKAEVRYYPYALETLKLMSERNDLKMILYTSSYPDEIAIYQNKFKDDGIKFDFINENPDVSDSKGSFGYYYDKPYFNVLMEDKAGFDPETMWEELYKYFSNTKYRPNEEWSMKTKESYHKQ